jgi:hypothetical protein
MEEKDVYDKIFVIGEDSYGLKVRVPEQDSQKLMKLRMRPAYYQAHIRVKVRGGNYQDLVPSSIPKLMDESVKEFHMYGKGTSAFSFMRRVLEIIGRGKRSKKIA